MSQTTEKLHLNDSLLFDFEARVADLSDYMGKPSVVLDRTAFYGESGGQLGDRGNLNDGKATAVVVDTQIDDQGRNHHLLSAPVAWEKGQPLTGRVDEAHRRDMMSQHTAQHMLSAAFWQIGKMETLSARLGRETSTIDLDAVQLDDPVIRQVEDRVNGLILEDRPIRPLYPDEVQLKQLGLRRPPKVTRDIRLIEVEQFDITPCGGTHCHRTGQVGPARIVSLERYKGITRVTFVAGARALAYFRTRDELLRDTARELGCGAPEILDVFASLRRENRDLSQTLGKTRAELIAHLCHQLHGEHPPQDGGFTPIPVLRPEDDLASMRKLVSALAARDDVFALGACRDAKSGDWAVVVERGSSVQRHVGQWFRDKSQALGGRGGGRPERAEGRWPADMDWDSLDFS